MEYNELELNGAKYRKDSDNIWEYFNTDIQCWLLADNIEELNNAIRGVN